MNDKINKAPVNYEDWLNLGRVIIPCLKGKPVVSDWSNPNFKITKEEWRTNYTHCEIALRLDQDIDLDVDNDLVKRFITSHIKSCDAVSGRRGNPSSHYWWKGKAPFKQFILPNELQKFCEGFPHGLTLCEIRHESKRYTIVPESKHSKANETVKWERYQDINEYPGNLNNDVGKIALATALCITYASSGQRDAYCTAIAGALIKHTEWTEKEIDDFVYDIATAANDDEADKRRTKGTTTRTTDRKFGVNKIHELTGYSHRNIQGLFNWIGLFQNITTQVSQDTIDFIEEYGANRYNVYLNVPEKEEMVQRKIWIDGPSLMNPKLFYDLAMSQAKVWLPRMKAKEFEEMMMAKFYVRKFSKDYVKEAEDKEQFKRIFLDYLDIKGVYTDKEQLFVHKLPYYNSKKSTIEFDLSNFEKELLKNRITLERVDLVNKIQTILKAKRDRGKYEGKSCVAWVIEGETTSNKKIIWEGESVVIGDEAGEATDGE